MGETEENKEIPEVWECGPLDDLEHSIANLINENVYLAYREVIKDHTDSPPCLSDSHLNEGDIAIEICFTESNRDDLILKVAMWDCISRELELYPEKKSEIVKALNKILDRLGNSENK